MASTADKLKYFIPWPIIAAARLAEVKAHDLRVAYWKRQLQEQPKLKQPVFMIGCPRSGTGLCGRLFSMHPEIANWSEAGWIWDPYGYYNPEADHHWEVDRVTEKQAQRLHASFEHRRREMGKPRFFNKHPRNSVRIDYIKEIFPDAFFIHVVRDGRAVVNSILNRVEREPRRKNIPFGHFVKPPNWRQWLRDDPVEQAALQWREIVRYVLNKRDELGKQYYQLKYEALCARPQDKIRELYNFTELSSPESTISKIPRELENRNFKYKQDLSESEIDTIMDAQAELLKDLGYIY